MNQKIPRVVIVGGGFAGLAAARALSGAKVEVILVDQRNHHVFQPLLYQVASAVLSPADIASPIRHILHSQQNCRVVLAQAQGVDLEKNQLQFEAGVVDFDYLIIAAGATHSYFGHPEWEKIAPGLKSLEDATEIRKRILLAFEKAEYESDQKRRESALTFAIVGGGATGVELAGAIQEIAAKTMQEDFRNIDTNTTRVILFQGGERLLPQFATKLSARAKTDLERMGVEVFLNTHITNLNNEGVFAGDTFIPVRNIFWAAGVKANPISANIATELDKNGRIIVTSDLSIAKHRNVFAIGDIAHFVDPKTKLETPGVAQAAIQMGRFVGSAIAKECSSNSNVERGVFHYRDKGSMATIGRAKAVAQIGRACFGGIIAWLMWSLVHILFIVSFRNRLAVSLNWLIHWITWSRGARIISGDTKSILEDSKQAQNSYIENVNSNVVNG